MRLFIIYAGKFALAQRAALRQCRGNGGTSPPATEGRSMKAETKIRRTKRHDTLRRAKRAGRRVYPAHREHDDAALFESLGNGNGHTVAAPNYDNA